MDIRTIEEQPESMGAGDAAPEPHGMSRRHWVAAAAAALAGSCAPEGTEELSEGEAGTGKAQAAASGVVLPPAERFAAWNQELRLKAPGRDVTLLDLDAVDHNIEVVKSQLGPSFALRIVTKSLPSLELIEYVMDRAGTNRLMAFSEGMLRALLERFGNDVDVLLGRPMPVEGAHRVFRDNPHEARRVRWLIDTAERMIEYANLADARHHRLDVAIELDVGLRRGGARSASEFLAMLDIVASKPHRLRLVGLMGYEGHVPFAPPGFDSSVEFAAVQQRYADFVQAGSQAYPALFQGSLVQNSGGSGTYYRYGADLVTPVNEIAMGSAFLLPEHFGDLSALGLRPATFFASPVLKRIEPAEVPFAEGYLPLLAQSDPTLETAFFMVAGGFPGNVVFPPGLVPNPLMPGGTEVSNLLPNQSLRNGSSDVPLQIGDFIFYHAWQGDGLGWLGMVEALRDDHIEARWPTFRDGCVKGCGGPTSPKP